MVAGINWEQSACKSGGKEVKQRERYRFLHVIMLLGLLNYIILYNTVSAEASTSSSEVQIQIVEYPKYNQEEDGVIRGTVKNLPHPPSEYQLALYVKYDGLWYAVCSNNKNNKINTTGIIGKNGKWQCKLLIPRYTKATEIAVYIFTKDKNYDPPLLHYPEGAPELPDELKTADPDGEYSADIIQKTLKERDNLNNHLQSENHRLQIILALLILLCIVLFFVTITFSIKYMLQKRKIDSFETKIIQLLKEIEAQRKLVKDTRISIHDIKNHVSFLRTPSESGEKSIEKIEEELWGILKKIDQAEDIIEVRQFLEKGIRKYPHEEIEFKPNFSKELLLVRIGKEEKFENIFFCTFRSNSLDAKKMSGMTIRIKAYQKNNRIHIIWQDNGEGMTEKRLAEIRTALKTDATHIPTPKPTGNGMGLINAHEFIKEHGGTLSVDSTPHGGTKIMITLPDIKT
ncbi:MAG: hypothetical protein GY797_00790 [Deltaproteobacteria bacterium]|nr:hypothetical protein [Deltaproteobacteria bacterium]